MTIGSVLLTQYQRVTDGRTDGRTEGQLINAIAVLFKAYLFGLFLASVDSPASLLLYYNFVGYQSNS